MVFNRKASFFLDLGSENAIPAQVAIAEAKPAEEPISPAEPMAFKVMVSDQYISEQPVSEQPVSVQPATDQPATGADVAITRTTAEAIAAELRAAQESLPPPSNVTFAPECLNPANALPSRRRLAGANLAGFKEMAAGMFRN
ncbi:MAG: hypothetical protein WD136_06585 [Cyanobium sp.]